MASIKTAAPSGPEIDAKAAAMDVAEAYTAEVNADPASTPQMRMEAAEQEMQTGAGIFMPECETEPEMAA